MKHRLQHAQPTLGVWSGPISPPISRGVRPRRSRLARWPARLSATVAVALAGYAGYRVLHAAQHAAAPAA